MYSVLRSAFPALDRARYDQQHLAHFDREPSKI